MLKKIVDKILKLKLLLVTLSLLLFSPFLHSYTGSLSGQHDVKIVKTKYFDIIYPASSVASATILYNEGDKLYETLASSLKLKYSFRLPVVITPSTDEFNAYYSSAPFSHIVIYDTAQTEDFSVFSKVFINTFKHELTHAISYNLHDGFWYGVEKVFGDTINPALLTVTQGFAEGISVAKESEEGEGRVNDSYHMHIVRQAKLDGTFPKYSEVQGARDTYPTGYLSYYFGGAFNAFILKTYGSEKYAKFWYKLATWHTMTYFTCFYEVYKISIRDAWRAFKESVYCPPIDKEPASNPWCISFPYKEKSKTLFSSPSAVQPKYLPPEETSHFYFYDKYRSEVKSAKILKSGKVKVTPFISEENINRIALTPSGSFMAISYSSAAGVMRVNRVRVYNTKSRLYYTLAEKHIRDATLSYYNGSLFLFCVSTLSQYSSLNIYKIELDGSENIADIRLVNKVKFSFEIGIFSPVIDESGNLYYIKKEGNKQYIETFNLTSLRPGGEVKKITKITLPDKVASIRNLTLNTNSFGTTLITFSYVEKVSFPRFASLSIKQDNKIEEKSKEKEEQNKEDRSDKLDKSLVRFNLMEADLSGGVYSPVFIDNNSILYQASFLDAQKLYILNNAFINKTSYETPLDSYEVYSVTGEDPAAVIPSIKLALNTDDKLELDANKKVESSIDTEESAKVTLLDISKPFNSFTYLFTGPAGTFLPFSISQSFHLNTGYYRLSGFGYNFSYMPLPIGVTYATSTPWTNPVFLISAGYSPWTNSVSFTPLITNNFLTETDLFKYALYGHVELDSEGFKQVYGNLNATLKLNLPELFYISIGDIGEIYYGRKSLVGVPDNPLQGLKDEYEYKAMRELLINNSASLSLGVLKKMSKGYANYLGFELLAHFDILYYKYFHRQWGAQYKYSSLSQGNETQADGNHIYHIEYKRNVLNLSEPDKFNFYKFDNVTVGKNDLLYVDKEEINYQNIGVDLTLRIPGPAPIALIGSLFPNNRTFLSFIAHIRAFNIEIQKSINYVPFFYSNRVGLQLTYGGYFIPYEYKKDVVSKERINALFPVTATRDSYKTYRAPIASYSIANLSKYFDMLGTKNCKYTDYVSAILSWTLTPNFGGFASPSFMFDLSVGFNCKINMLPGDDRFSLTLCGQVVF